MTTKTIDGFRVTDCSMAYLQDEVRRFHRLHPCPTKANPMQKRVYLTYVRELEQRGIAVEQTPEGEVMFVSTAAAANCVVGLLG